MAPANVSVDPQTQSPYNQALFCRPKGRFVTPSVQEGVLAQLLEQASPQQLSVLAQQALSKLPAVKRVSQGITHIGFFQTGILTGGVLLLSTVLGATGVFSYYAFGLVRSRILQG
jgi:hypothetical protein